MNEAKAVAMTDEQIAARISDLNDWEMADDKRLVRSFEFKDFISAVRFVDRIAEVAEIQGHHPDLYVGWGKVTAHLTTHSAGGVTGDDFELAAAIDRL